MTKICFSCGVEKPIDDFPLRIDSKDGHRGICRECRNKQARTHDRSAYAKHYRYVNRERLSEYNKLRNLIKKIRVLSYYSQGEPRCVCCGETEIVFLCFDHIKGGGTQHRKTLGSMGRQFYYWLERNNYPEGYRVLCYNCNMSIGFYGFCPHARGDT